MTCEYVILLCYLINKCFYRVTTDKFAPAQVFYTATRHISIHCGNFQHDQKSKGYSANVLRDKNNCVSKGWTSLKFVLK